MSSSHNEDISTFGFLKPYFTVFYHHINAVFRTQCANILIMPTTAMPWFIITYSFLTTLALHGGFLA